MNAIRLALLPFALLVASPVSTVEPDAPTVQWTGPHSAIDDREFHRITDQATFDDLWQRHRADRLERNLRDWPVIPRVDFEQSIVVAFFRGPSRVDDGEIVKDVLKQGDTLVIRFDALTFQTMSFGDEPEPAYDCTPYGIWVLDRHDGPIVIEEGQRRLIQAPPEWVEVHRWPASDR